MIGKCSASELPFKALDLMSLLKDIPETARGWRYRAHGIHPGAHVLLTLGSPPPRGQVGAIVITPTRELAIQIDEVLSHFTKHFPQFR